MRETIQTLQELQQMDESELIQWGIMQSEGTIKEGMAEVRQDIRQRRESDWPPREAVKEHLAGMEPHQQRDQFEQVIGQLEHDMARCFFSWHEMALLGDGLDQFEQAIRSLVIACHSPVVQETLLLAVDPDYRPRARDQFREFGVLLWGWYGAIRALETDELDPYLSRLAAYWEMDPDELRQQAFSEGVSDGQGQQ